jgi:hypothetical protein
VNRIRVTCDQLNIRGLRGGEGGEGEEGEGGEYTSSTPAVYITHSGLRPSLFRRNISDIMQVHNTL